MMMMMMMKKKRYKGEESVEREHDEQRRSLCVSLCVVFYAVSFHCLEAVFFVFCQFFFHS